VRREVPPKAPPPRAELRRSLARERAPEGGVGRPSTPEPVGVTGVAGFRYRKGRTRGRASRQHPKALITMARMGWQRLGIAGQLTNYYNGHKKSPG
jgi:hypothetical protein